MSVNLPGTPYILKGDVLAYKLVGEVNILTPDNQRLNIGLAQDGIVNVQSSVPKTKRFWHLRMLEAAICAVKRKPGKEPVVVTTTSVPKEKAVPFCLKMIEAAMQVYREPHRHRERGKLTVSFGGV